MKTKNLKNSESKINNICKNDIQVNTDINSGDIQFSKRELQILELMIIGYENRSIAEKLFVSVHTVKAYVSIIMAKLNAKNRTNTAYIVLKNHILN